MAGKRRVRRITRWILLWILFNVVVIGAYMWKQNHQSDRTLEMERAQLRKLQGVNREVTDGEYDRTMAVVCDNGTFIGTEEDEVRSYKGIPYALPPVGERRWKPPVDAPAGDGVYEAVYFGKSGIQTEAETERASLYLQGEDCLTLNVWTSRAMHNDAPKTVMVFFHGGAYGWGGTADPIYDGHNFVEAHPDIVLVTVNYRIGLMGFMDFSEVEGGEAYEKSGNLGLLDQISALRWVQRNISAFGGDPENVTIFGESAGASSVSFLPLIEEARGLFRRAIAESGSVAFSFSREEARTLTQELLKEAKASSMKDLLSLSEQELMKINEKLNDYNNFPERDGIVLPEDVYAAYASGKASDIDMLTGTNADEARYWIGEVGGYPVYRIASRLLYGSVLEQIDEEDRPYAEALLALLKGDPVWTKTEFFNELLFRAPAIRQAESHVENGGKHYMYYWTKESDIPEYGACHAIELAYVFNNTEDTIFTGKPADPALASEVQEMWVNFAKTGDPSTEQHRWEPYDTVRRTTMILDDEIRSVEDPLPQQRVLTEPLLKYQFNGYYRVFDYALLYLRNSMIKSLLVLLGIHIVIGGFLFLRKRKRRKA